MKKKAINLILFTSFFLVGSQVINPQSITGDLPIIDFSKQYPPKEKCIQDIADIEYIPFETTNDVLLSDLDVFSYISDKYILVHSIQRGDLFVFHRTGKIYTHFNHKGQSGREYLQITGTILDEKNEEIFVCSRNIQVYSLNGEYKRTLNINTIQNERKVYNFDDEALLLYDDILVEEPGRMFGNKEKSNPYSLISKKDGSLISVLDIYLPLRYSNRISIPLPNNMYTIKSIYYSFGMYYGSNFVIADKSSDTLFLLTQNRELTPQLIRKPSVHASEPRKIWLTVLTTEKFMLIGYLTLDFKSNGGRYPVFMYEFKTGEINEMTFFYTEFGNLRGFPRGLPPSPAGMAKNMTATLIQAPSIIEAYKRKQLKGDIEKLAMTLDVDDNPVVMIVKFK